MIHSYLSKKQLQSGLAVMINCWHPVADRHHPQEQWLKSASPRIDKRDARTCFVVEHDRETLSPSLKRGQRGCSLQLLPPCTYRLCGKSRWSFFSIPCRNSNLPTIKHQEGTHLCACISVPWALDWNHWNSKSEREFINWKLDTRHLFNICSTSVFGHGSVVYSPNRSAPVASTKPYSRLELSAK